MNKLERFAVALPLVVLGAWVAKLEWQERSGAVVTLRVRGFDPRDLLAGHYLQYTVDYGPAGECAAEAVGEEACLCLTADAATSVHEANWIGPCDARPTQCSVYLEGTCSYGRFEANIERFYFPETFQSALAVVPEKSTITAVVRSNGEAVVTGFQVDGVDVLDYARTRTAE